MRQLRNRGTALGYALIIITAVTIVSGTAMLYGLNATHASSNQRIRGQPRGVAQGGLADALHRVGDRYIAEQPGNTAGTAAAYQTWLSTQSDATGTHIANTTGTVTYTMANVTQGTTTLLVTLTRQDSGPNGTNVNVAAVANDNASPPNVVSLRGTYTVG